MSSPLLVNLLFAGLDMAHLLLVECGGDDLQHGRPVFHFYFDDLRKMLIADDCGESDQSDRFERIVPTCDIAAQVSAGGHSERMGERFIDRREQVVSDVAYPVNPLAHDNILSEVVVLPAAHTVRLDVAAWRCNHVNSHKIADMCVYANLRTMCFDCLVSGGTRRACALCGLSRRLVLLAHGVSLPFA